MSDILRNHALTHIWAEPLQDHQHRIKPSRITPRTGAFKEVNVMWEKVPLPNYNNATDKRIFHVYQLGQVPPFIFALELTQRVWYRADDLVMEFNTVIDVYADNGAIIPRNHYYLYQNYDGNLLLAIVNDVIYLGDETKTTPYQEVIKARYSLDDHPITIRFYNNGLTHAEAWLDTAVNPSQILKDFATRITSVGTYTAFMVQVNNIRQSYNGQGGGLFFLDGFLISEPNGYRDEYSGKQLYFQYDETIKSIQQFEIHDIPGFRSDRDYRKDKYLLLSQSTDKKLEYFDDCDFYVVNKDINGYFKGVRIDVYDESVVRQLTHNAWSLSQDQVIYPSQWHDFLSDVTGLTLLVVVRFGGMNRGIEFQNNRIEELYHLSYNEVLQAMSGVNSTMPEWAAPELENSAYMRVMSSQEKDITDTLVEDAYGYNAATKAVAKSLYVVTDGIVTIDDGLNIAWDINDPNGLKTSTKRTFFWYDVNGTLLGYTVNNSLAKTVVVPVQYSEATKLEVIAGDLVIGVGDSGVTSDEATVPDNAFGYFGYRNYVCNIVNGAPDEKWIDVTDSIFCDYIKPPTGSPYIRWNYALLNAANYYPATRFANTVNIHHPYFNPTTFNGVFDYQINRISNASMKPLQVPPGHVDVFMNGEILVKDLDFYYVNPGSIVVVRKPVVAVGDVRITIRFYGYANKKTNKPFSPRDQGFIKNGLLSANQKFNPWHDRDIRIVVAGKLKLASEVTFADVGSPQGDLLYDGKPYAVEDYQSLVEPFTSKKTVDYIADAMEIDKRVSDYLTPRLPEPVISDEYITPYRHQLYSPIMGTFIQMCLRNIINDTAVDLEATDESILRDYGYIANAYGSFDPVVLGHDPDYVYVHPHPFINTVEVTSKQYAFLEKVNRVFLKGELDLTSSVTIRSGT